MCACARVIPSISFVNLTGRYLLTAPYYSFFFFFQHSCCSLHPMPCPLPPCESVKLSAIDFTGATGTSAFSSTCSTRAVVSLATTAFTADSMSTTFAALYEREREREPHKVVQNKTSFILSFCVPLSPHFASLHLTSPHLTSLHLSRGRLKRESSRSAGARLDAKAVHLFCDATRPRKVTWPSEVWCTPKDSGMVVVRCVSTRPDISPSSAVSTVSSCMKK